VTWRELLGHQIRSAREVAGLTQAQLAEKTSVKREHISNIELGKHSPAVKIVTEIARALNTRFLLDGCSIDPSSNNDPLGVRPISVPKQMELTFGVKYQFDTQLVSLAARSATELELRATLSRKRRA
jgi:transcriptional regulator with XRE-family HTH domain